jgi:phytoene/squalene synthetase
VGRIVLHLFQVNQHNALASADQICSALQLINFAQDLGQDTERGRC